MGPWRQHRHRRTGEDGSPRAPGRGTDEGDDLEGDDVGADDGPSVAPDERAARLVGVLGNKGVAQLLGVSESQPSRWKTGEEVPNARSAPLLVDLDHVVGRLLLIWDQSVVFDWLIGPNGFLEGARPIDVIATRGTNEVVDAVEAEAAAATVTGRNIYTEPYT